MLMMGCVLAALFFFGVVGHAHAQSFEFKTGAINITSGGTVGVTFSSAMANSSYSILLNGGSTGTDVMYSMTYSNKAAGGFTIVAEDDTGSAENANSNNWMALTYGDWNLGSSKYVKCAVSGGTAGDNTVTFSSAFPDTNYSIIANAITDTDSPVVNFNSGSKTTSQAVIRIEDDGGATEAVTDTNYCAFSHGEYTVDGANIKAGSATTNGSGVGSVTFSTAFPDTSYIVVAMAQGVNAALCSPEVGTKTTTGVSLQFEDDADANCASRNYDWVAISTGEFEVAPSLSGTLYADEGSTAITTGKTIKAYVDGTVSTATTDSNGDWSISAAPAEGETAVVWVDGDQSTRGALVLTAGSGALSGMDLYQDHVIIRNEDDGATSLDEMGTYDGRHDQDISYVVREGDGELLIDDGQKLYIWSGDTFTGATSTVLGGDLENNGTLDLTAGTTSFPVDATISGNEISYGPIVTGSSTQRVLVTGTHWIPASTPSLAHPWQGVTYGEGLFVAVACGISVDGACNATAGGSRVMTSPDGITWTGRSASQANEWRKVAYGEGRFVAVAPNGTNRVMTSEDGITWTNRTAASADMWSAVAYGEGRFVALSYDGTAMYSDDGLTWSSGTASGNGIYNVMFNEEHSQFVAVGDNRVATSPDGITWTNRTAAENNWWNGIAYGNGTYVAVSSLNAGTMNVMTSPDAITWTARDATYDGSWIGVTFTGEYFVAIGYGDLAEQVMISTDGINWTPVDEAESAQWEDITYGDGKVVAINSDGVNRAGVADGSFLVSVSNFENNGVTWTGRSASAANNWLSVTYGNGLFVAVAETGTNRVMTSSDGITWTARAEAEANNWYSVTYGNGLFVAVAQTGTNRVMTSSDGVNWTPRSAAGNDDTWYSVTYGNGLFVAVGSGTDRVMTSPDGITWTARSAAEANAWTSVIYAEDLFVAVSNNGTNRVMTSPDGITWTARTDAGDHQWYSITHGEGTFVVVATSGTDQVMTSPDGITWTARTAAEANAWTSVTYGNGLFVAVAESGTNRVMTSPDGITWTARSAAESTFWNSVTFGKDTFVAVSYGGTNRVMTSESGSYADTTQTFTADAVVNGAFTITASSTVAAPDALTLNSDFTNNGTFTQASGATTIDLENNTVGYDVAGATYDSVLESIADTGPAGLHFRSDGLKMYTFGWSTDIVREFTLSSAWDLSTASQVNTFSVAAQEDFAGDLYFNDTGTKFYITADGAAAVGEYAVSTPWDVSSASYTDYLDVSGKETNPYGVEFSSDGTKMYVVGGNSDAVHQYNLSVAWDVSTGVFSQTFSVASQDTTPTGIHFTSDGMYMYMVGHSTSAMYEYALSTAWDISTAVLVSGETFDFGAESFTEFSPMQVAFGNDGVKMYMYGFDEQDVFQFTTGTEGGGTPDTDKDFTGSGETTFADFTITADDSTVSFTNDVAMGDLTIGATATVTAPSGTITVEGNYTNNGEFDHNDGTMVIEGNSSLSGNLTGNSALGNLTATSTGELANTAAVWEEESASASSQWSGVAYGNGTFVAVSWDGDVMSSPVGITWTSRTPAVGNSWQAVTYGGGLFVAVANTGTSRVMTSPDGITWTARTSGDESSTWREITYGNGQFVAVAYSGTSRVMTSPDGITWTGRTAAEANDWMGITYGNGTYVAVSDTGTNRVMTSQDGITWTSRSASSASGWQRVVYGEGIFVAVSETDTAMTSPDGITWTARTTPGNSDWYGLAYGGGIFASLGDILTGSTYIMTSEDGITWTEQTAPNTNFFRSLTYGEGKFVGVSTDGTNQVLVSSDGSYENMVTFADNASTTDLTIGSASTTVVAPALLSIADDYTNDGTFTHNGGAVYFTGSTAQTLQGNMASTSAFNDVYFSGNSTKTFSDNASTSDLSIASGSTVAAPSALTITGDYTNSGTFNSGSGIVYINGTTTASTTVTGGWDVTTAVYDGAGKSTASEENNITSLAFSPDGTRMFVAGYNMDTVYSYTLSTPWDVTTAVYDNKSFSILAQDQWVEKVSFKTDGTKMYMLGSENDAVFSYTLGTPWDVTTASYDSSSFSIAQDVSPFGMHITEDGTRMYISGDSNNRIYSYTLGTPWVISSATYDSKSFLISGQESAVQDVHLKDDGTKMYVVGTGSNTIFPYTLGTPWDITTATYDGAGESVSAQESSVCSIEFNADGSKVYIYGAAADTVFPYSLDYDESTVYTGTTTLSGNMTGTSAFNDLTLDSPQTLALDGITWTARSAATNNSWQGLVYGEGLFVAVSNGGTNNVMTSPDGITWTARTSADESAGWNSVTYGNGIFVAVAESGTNRVMTSPDGITWTARTASQANSWYSVAFGNDMFVAVSVDGTNRVMTSPDGITWTNRTAAQASQWSVVTYGNSLFVALSWDGTIMTSPDGITWTTRTPLVTQSSWHGIVYAEGLFVAVGNGTALAMTSPDGITWTERTAPADNWESVTHTGHTFVAVACGIGNASCNTTAGGNRVMTSPDGITWTGTPATEANRWMEVVYGNGMLVAVSDTGTNRVMTSNSGSLAGGVVFENNASTSDLTITASTTVDAPALMSIAGDYTNDGTIDWGTGTTTLTGNDQTLTGALSSDSAFNNLVVKVSSGSNAEGGTTWTSSNVSTQGWYSVTYGEGLFVAVAYDGDDQIITSPDGITWTARSTPGNNQTWLGVTYGNGTFVAVSQDGTNRVMTSPDGITWTARSAAEANSWISVTYGEGLFVAVAFDGTNRVMTSPDGITWTARSAAEANSWVSVTYGEGLFVAVASDGTNRVMTSPDGITWTARAAAEANDWFSVAYGNSTFVAVAHTGTNRVMTSPDGITWTARAAAEASGWFAITYGDGLFVAVADTGTNRVMTSPDGITWTARAAAEANDWFSVTYGNGTFVAVGDIEAGSNRVMISNSGSRVDGTIRFSTPVEASKFISQTPGVTFEFPAYATSTFASLRIDGEEGGEAILRSSKEGTQWGLDVTTPISVTYVDVQDSNACSGNPNITATDSTDSGNNTCWDITGGEPVPGTISSASNQVFGYGQATTTIATITITDGETPAITAANDLRIKIDTSATDMLWDTTDTTATFGGTASGKVANPVSYENGGATLVVPVSNDFVGSDTLTISGLSFVQFGTVNTATSTLVLITESAGEDGGSAWTAHSAAQANSWSSVAYESELLVAVAENGTNRVMTSSDGSNWTARSAAGDNDSWSSITYGEGIFVAVSTGGSDDPIMTSPDGITWTARSVATDQIWSEVTYGSGKFVAVGCGGYDNGCGTNASVMSSDDGITWSAQAVSGNWQSVTYGNGLFVAVGSGNTRVITSPDGTTWTPRSAAGDNDWWTSVTYGNGLFVAVGSGSDRVMTSPDGINWTARSAAGDNDSWASVVYASDLFVAVGSGSDYVMTSPDGNNWTVRTAAEANQWSSITYASDLYETGTLVAVANSGTNRVMTAPGSSVAQITATDDKTIAIHGAATLSEHTAGQVENEFSYQNQSDVPLYTFRLAPEGENATISSAAFALSGIRRIDSSNLSDLRLYRDNNSDGSVDAGDNQIGGAGEISVTEQSGTVTFSTSWSATTTKDYILTSDVSGVLTNEYVTISLPTTGLSGTGATTAGAIVPLGSVSSVQHIRGGNNGSGALHAAEVGGEAPEGDGDVGGGGSQGGGGVGEEDNGEEIGNEPGFEAPSATGELYSEWTGGSNALSSDGVYATAASTNLRQSYSLFGFNVPGGNTVQGIEVKLEASGSTGAGTIQVALSWNGDSSVTATKATSVLTGSDAVYTLGGPSDTWGRGWTPAELGDANFVVRVIGQPDQNTVRVDAIQVRPYTQAGGGGGGGGGEI